MATQIKGPFKLVDGKVVRDDKARLAKLDLCARLRERKSKRVRPAKKGEVQQ